MKSINTLRTKEITRVNVSTVTLILAVFRPWLRFLSRNRFLIWSAEVLKVKKQNVLAFLKAVTCLQVGVHNSNLPGTHRAFLFRCWGGGVRKQVYWSPLSLLKARAYCQNILAHKLNAYFNVVCFNTSELPLRSTLFCLDTWSIFMIFSPLLVQYMPYMANFRIGPTQLMRLWLTHILLKGN